MSDKARWLQQITHQECAAHGKLSLSIGKCRVKALTTSAYGNSGMQLRKWEMVGDFRRYVGIHPRINTFAIPLLEIYSGQKETYVHLVAYLSLIVHSKFTCCYSKTAQTKEAARMSFRSSVFSAFPVLQPLIQVLMMW